jgi:hypothetical protein
MFHAIHCLFFQTSFPPAKAIQAALCVLLDVCAVLYSICRYPSDTQVNQAANSIITSYDVLADLLESIGRFVNRLEIHSQISHTTTTDKTVLKFIVELISTLALLTRKLKQRGSRELLLVGFSPSITQSRAVRFAKNYFAVKDIKTARHRLDQLINEELATTAAKLLEAIHGDIEDFQFMDGEQTRSTCDPPSIDALLSRR